MCSVSVLGNCSGVRAAELSCGRGPEQPTWGDVVSRGLDLDCICIARMLLLLDC